jgi:hypothetical protein
MLWRKLGGVSPLTRLRRRCGLLLCGTARIDAIDAGLDRPPLAGRNLCLAAERCVQRFLRRAAHDGALLIDVTMVLQIKPPASFQVPSPRNLGAPA